MRKGKTAVGALALCAAVGAACGGGGGGGSGKVLPAATVSGTVRYQKVPSLADAAGAQSGRLRFDLAEESPVRGAIVEVRQNGSAVLASGTTGDDGTYSLTFEPTEGASLEVVVQARTLAPPLQVEDNTDRNLIWALGSGAGSLAATGGTVNLLATHGWNGTSYVAAQRRAPPFAILDAMTTAGRAVAAVLPAGVTLPALRVNWSPDNFPNGGGTSPATGNIGTSHYNPNDGEIYILGQALADTDEFDSHVIVHEWGHYLEDRISRSDSPGGPHGGEVLDPRLAWGEGYGDALPKVLLGGTYVDTFGALNTGFAFDAESPPSAGNDDPNPGPFSEFSVMRLFYDLFDGGDGEAHDQIALGLAPLVQVLAGVQQTTPALTTVGSFVDAVRDLPGVDGAALDALLAHYTIGPIDSPFGAGDPDLEGIYTAVAAFPFSATPTLSSTSGFAAQYPNKRVHVQYYVFTGTGSTVTVRTTATSDVDVQVYRNGTLVAQGVGATGNETVPVATVNGTTYVAVLTSWKTTAGSVTPTISFSSP